MNLNEENIIQILGEFLVCEGFAYYQQLCDIFKCLSDEDCDHIFFDFIQQFIKNEPIHKSLQLINAFLTSCTSPQPYICQLIELQHYELLAMNLQIQIYTDNQIKQLVLDKLKEVGQNDYNKIFILQRLYFLLDPCKKDSAEQIFANNLKIIQQIFATIQEETLVEYLKVQSILSPYCREVQQQKLLKLITLIKQSNKQMGFQLQWAIYEVCEQLGQEQVKPELGQIEETQTRQSFRLFFVKQKFMQNVRQLNNIIRDVEDEHKENYKQYTQWQLQL